MSGFDTWFSTEFAVATWDPYEPAHSHLGPRHLGPRQAYDTRALYWHNGHNIQQALAGCDSRIIMDRALGFIRGAVASRQPFLSVIWFHAPHAPVVGGAEFRQLYPQATEDQQHYYAVVTALDAQIGRLRAVLRELGVAENTIVWFCSDNGPEGNPGPTARHQGSAGPFRGRKRSLYEGGIRVPALLEWPAAIPAARQTDVPCVTSDFLPTLLDVLQIPLPADRPYDGISLLPLIQGTTDRRPRPIAFRFHKQAALSDNRFKLVLNNGSRRPPSDNGQTPWSAIELYDLLADPRERHNLADQFPQVVAEMRPTLDAFLNGE